MNRVAIVVAFSALLVAASRDARAEGLRFDVQRSKLENGLRVLVPPFISTGEKIVVSTDEVAYVKRAE